LRVLKTGQAKSQAAAGLTIGIATRQSQRLWQTYQQKGFSGMLSTHYEHIFGKLSAQQLSQLLTFLRSDQAGLPKLANSKRSKLFFKRLLG